MAFQSSRFSASSVDTVCVSHEGQPSVVEIALDQLTPQSVARVFSVSFFFCSIGSLCWRLNLYLDKFNIIGNSESLGEVYLTHDITVHGSMHDGRSLP